MAYKDGTKTSVISDETWKITNRGPIRTANEYDGETYDENYENLCGWSMTGFDDSAWLQAELVEAPEGQLSAQPNPNITVMEKMQPGRFALRPEPRWQLYFQRPFVPLFAVQLLPDPRRALCAANSCHLRRCALHES